MTEKSPPERSELIKAAIVIMGISGISGQVLLLRELLIISFGNELIIGVILANWLLLEAMGSWLGGRIKLRQHLLSYLYLAIQLLFAISLPLCLILTRFAKEYAGIPSGSGMGLITIFISSFLILMPVSFSHGFLFPLYCRIFSRNREQGSGSINRVYVWELLGTIIGGILLTYILIPLLPTLTIGFLVSLLNLSISFLLIAAVFRQESEKGLFIGRRVAGAILIIFVILNLYLLLPQVTGRLHNYSIARQWQNHRVIHYQNSIYGNITVTESEGQYNFFSNGQPVITTPDADIVFSETFVHIPLLSHPDPAKILIIGGGAGGIIAEVLKHSPEKVVYTELDPLLIELVRRIPTPLTDYEINHPAVSVEQIDGRRYIEESSLEFDVILIGIGQPDDLQANRLFTVDFYQLLQSRMNPDAILAFTLPGSLTYLTDELRHLNRIAENSLREVFAQHHVIPGDRNLILANNTREPLRLSPSEMEARLVERDIETQLISRGYLQYVLHPRWQDFYRESTEEVTTAVNRDISPVAVFWSLSYWNRIFSPASQKIFGFFQAISYDVLTRWLLIIVIIVPLPVIIFVRRPGLVALPVTIFTSGFAGMLFDLAVIYIFQILFGYVFLWIGMLFVAYMSGAMLGAVYNERKINRPGYRAEGSINRLLVFDTLIILFALSLPWLLNLFNAMKLELSIYNTLPYIFLLLPLVSGFLIGSQFPLAVKQYLGQSGSYEKSSGLLYALDLAGGWLGGIIGGVFLLPLFGLTKTMLIIILLKVSSLLLLILLRLKSS